MINTEPTKKTARLAGFIYLIVVITGIFHFMYVPSTLIDWQDPSRTVANITASETLFRISILAGLVCFIAFLILPFVLYRLLSHVHKMYALLMVVLVVVSVPISLGNLQNHFAILTLLKAKYLASSDLQTQVMLFLRFYNNGNQIATIFWGLWLFPFGYLVFKSEVLPKVLGVFLMVGCFTDIIDFGAGFLSSRYGGSLAETLMTIPGSVGEIGICLWLLIAGVKTSHLVSGRMTEAT
jgi:hypothetical protein